MIKFLLRMPAVLKIGPILAAIGAVFAALLAARLSGGKAARQKRHVQDLEEYTETRSQADEAARVSEGDIRPPTERIEKHGRLRK